MELTTGLSKNTRRMPTPPGLLEDNGEFTVSMAFIVLKEVSRHTSFSNELMSGDAGSKSFLLE